VKRMQKSVRRVPEIIVLRKIIKKR